MNVEENRLRTFSNWPASAAVDAAQIAKAGFYYSGRGLEVQCFLCETNISDWNYGDHAILRHRQASPDCPFILNHLEICNVPPIPTASINSVLASSSTETLQEGNTAQVQSFSQQRNPQEEYRTLSQRLQSFANWPISSIVSPDKLAKAGFYYLQEDDRVQCIYCGGIVCKWEPGDDPDIEHMVHFPKCDFYMHQSDNDTLYIPNVKLMPGTTASFTELGIQTHSAPKEPNHATYEGRLRTFCGWPENLKQTPEILSSAGFYYSGYSDHVRCFHCDGALLNWEATDDAWTEHAKWFPKCEFVNLVRGQEFIKECLKSRAPMEPSIFEDVAQNEVTDVVETSPSLTVALPPTQEVTEATVERLLDSPPALAALEIGLHVGRVKRALRKRMEETGIPYTNADQLIQDVLHYQIMEDDSRLENDVSEPSSSELIALLNLMIIEESSTATEQYDNVQRISTYEEISGDKSEIYSNGKEKLNTCADENDSLDAKASVKTKETVSLEEENRRLKEARLCKICMDREVAIVLLPCGHLATCVHCALSLTFCPMCRREIRATVRTFLS